MFPRCTGRKIHLLWRAKTMSTHLKCFGPRGSQVERCNLESGKKPQRSESEMDSAGCNRLKGDADGAPVVMALVVDAGMVLVPRHHHHRRREQNCLHSHPVSSPNSGPWVAEMVAVHNERVEQNPQKKVAVRTDMRHPLFQMFPPFPCHYSLMYPWHPSSCLTL